MVEWKTTNSIEELIGETNDVTKNMSQEDENYWWDTNGSNLPVSPEYRKRVSALASYPIWACNDDGFCLVGATADEIEHITDIDNTNQ